MRTELVVERRITADGYARKVDLVDVVLMDRSVVITELARPVLLGFDQVWIRIYGIAVAAVRVTSQLEVQVRDCPLSVSLIPNPT